MDKYGLWETREFTLFRSTPQTKEGDRSDSLDFVPCPYDPLSARTTVAFRKKTSKDGKVFVDPSDPSAVGQWGAELQEDQHAARHSHSPLKDGREMENIYHKVWRCIFVCSRRSTPP